MAGVAKRWNCDRGFGFIGPEDGGDDLFCHFSQIKDGNALVEGAAVHFVKQLDDAKGKHRAVDVLGGVQEDRMPPPPPPGGPSTGQQGQGQQLRSLDRRAGDEGGKGGGGDGGGGDGGGGEGGGAEGGGGGGGRGRKSVIMEAPLSGSNITALFGPLG